MFPALSTVYYWEENREEIYRSAPTRVRVSRNRRGGRGGRRWRSAGGRHHHSASDPESEKQVPECLGHGTTWTDKFRCMLDSLCGRILAERDTIREEMTDVVCSCEERNKAKCRKAIIRFGFIVGSNLPRHALYDRMRFTELYFHNVLNSPQFNENYIDNLEGSDQNTDTIRALHENKDHIFNLVQRCVFHNDLKAYRLLDIIRLYIQKQCRCVVHIPLSSDKDEAVNELLALEKNDHINIVKTTYGCQIIIGNITQGVQNFLELHVSAANIQDLNEVKSYFQPPLGFKVTEQTADEQESKDENKVEQETECMQLEKQSEVEKPTGVTENNKTDESVVEPQNLEISRQDLPTETLENSGVKEPETRPSLSPVIEKCVFRSTIEIKVNNSHCENTTSEQSSEIQRASHSNSNKMNIVENTSRIETKDQDQNSNDVIDDNTCLQK